MLLRHAFLGSILLSACTELRFEGTGGAGASGGADTTSTGAGGTGAGGAGTGGCGPEICDGLDNDCNNITDDPPSGSGSFCGCEWLSANEKLYVACPTMASVDDVKCPGGMELVVLQSLKEQEVLGALIPENSSGFVGLRQADGASNPRAGWSWVGRIGMPPPWGEGQPNDSTAFAESVEGGRQQCGFLFRDTATSYHLADGLCSGEFDTRLLCEESRVECEEGAECTTGFGCNGVFACDETTEPSCLGMGTSNGTCNGLDDECDGDIGNDDCACTPFTSPAGRQYKVCTTSVRPSEVECGEGFRLAVPTTQEEFAFLRSQIPKGAERWIGGFQLLGSATPADGWVMLDGSTLLNDQWEPSEPSDDDNVEDGGQDCLFLNEGGLRDGYCLGTRAAFCEEVP